MGRFYGGLPETGSRCVRQDGSPRGSAVPRRWADCPGAGLPGPPVEARPEARRSHESAHGATQGHPGPLTVPTRETTEGFTSRWHRDLVWSRTPGQRAVHPPTRLPAGDRAGLGGRLFRPDRGGGPASRARFRISIPWASGRVFLIPLRWATAASRIHSSSRFCWPFWRRPSPGESAPHGGRSSPWF